MDLKCLYTTNEEMDQLEHRDATTNIVGFVTSTSAPVPAGRNEELLFKFVVSNGNKKINVLIWGTLIEKYCNDIVSNVVIDINGGYCKAASLSKYEEKQNFVPFEIIVKENTEISYLGYHIVQNTVASKLQTVSFDDIHTAEGLIEIAGYIRTKFSLMHNRSGSVSYGLGAITDGKKKLTVQVKQFVANNLEKGDFVKVKGIVTGQDSLVTVFCESMNDIMVDAEAPRLAPELIKRGGRPIKRIRP